ncbi:RDD family protein [Chitinimonas arctica]|uniref:RDD family protein n=1 Tax=Chitinimonas arctica TaxID=2594795 RepID=A0A516SEQ9_9NEIS|nr:RDD family protein [Chitinimonas arctica]QDQ26600.1 RDD family protein [Chitinimonas arctica]
MTIEHPLAPRGRRLVSLCYESLLLLAVLVAAGMLFELLLPAGLIGTPVEFTYLLLVMFGYFAWCWRRSGQTLAMKTWRLQLRGTDNRLPSWRAIVLRFAIALLMYAPLLPALVSRKHVPDMPWLPWLACIWAALPWLWSLLDREHQALYDRLAGTRIVLLPINRAD